MTSSNSLYFKDKNNTEFTKTANIDSPSFIGTPRVPTPRKSNSKRITNVEFVKAYMHDKIHNLGLKTTSAKSNELTLNPNKEYFINVSGLIDTPESTDNITLGYVVITDDEDNVIAKSDTSVSSNYKSTGGLIQSGSLALRTPMNGIVRAYVNYSGTKGKFPANYMCAIEVNRDEYCDIYIQQSNHQTMYVIANGESYSDAECMITKNSVYNVKVVPDIGYVPGTVSPSDSGIIEDTTVFTITDATYNPCYIGINNTPNQSIVVNNEGIDHTESFTARYGSEFTVSVIVRQGYIPGTPSISEGVFTSSINITASEAKAVYRTVSIQQQLHQTITLTRLDTGDTTTTLFSVPDGTRILAEVEAAPYYTPGTLNVDKYFYANEDIVVTSTPPKTRL